MGCKQRAAELLALLSEDPDNEAAREEFVREHMRLLRYFASKFAGRGEPLDDLIQVASIGLLKALKRFKPELGYNFSTFATPTIIGELRRYFRDLGSAIKMPRQLQDLNLRVMRAAEAYQREHGHAPTIKTLAVMLESSEESIIEAQEFYGRQPVSLDTVTSRGDDDSASTSLSAYLGIEDHGMDHVENVHAVQQAMTALSKREQAIIYLRYFREMSQADIAAVIGVSQMQVSRLLRTALERMRVALSR